MTSREDWPDVRAHIREEFGGEEPGSHLEAELIDLYEANPQSVLSVIPSIAKSKQAGKINSGWAVLKAAAAKRAVQTTNPTISKQKLIRNADQWVRTAGQMFDRWSEVEDELFGERGRLRELATPTLRTAYRRSWEQARPHGEQIEADELQRAQHWRETRAAVQADRLTPDQLRTKLQQLRGGQA